MKRFFNLFKSSHSEILGENRSRNLRCLVTTALLVAVSMALESFTIELPFAKINFSFIAIASIGMLYGPFVSFFAGGICDIVGYIAHPTGTFMPVYTLIAMLQGMIYGIVLYSDWKEVNSKVKPKAFIIRVILARLFDVIIINLCLNTTANLHYGYIHADSLMAAIYMRIAKNAIQLVVDIPLLLALLPVVIVAHRQIIGRSIKKG